MGPNKPLEFYNDQPDLPIPPYIIGAWLGDGHHILPSLCGIDEEIIMAKTNSIGHGILY